MADVQFEDAVPECTCLHPIMCQFAKNRTGVWKGQPGYDEAPYPKNARTCTRIQGDAEPCGGARS